MCLRCNMKTLILIFCSFTLCYGKNLFAKFNSENEPKDWWQTGSFYQIYPRSFKDSDGDGIGDLNGITEKLPYLQEIGITATWLSPIFKSPMADFGYDISDFFDIQAEYGTLSDFDRLITKAKELNVKIILDFVPNHSSDENDWFVRSVNKEEEFKDFYVWHPGFPDPNNSSNRLPPSNWISVFHGSAWQFNDKRQEFYLHQFTVKQPDLNYRNPKVVEKMKSVLRFWLDRGVSGFRIDAVPHLFEITPDENGNFRDEPLSGTTNDPTDWNYLNHIYTKDQNETIDMVYQWRQVLDEYKNEHGGDTRIMMTESYSPLDVVMQYYGDGNREGAHLPFNFQLLEQLKNESNAYDYKNAIDSWLSVMPKGRTANWVVGNHDQNRVATRLGTDRIDIVNMIVLTLPGASVTYNGEEIGMTDVWISWNDTVDPAACNTNPSVYEQYSRDPERTPFQWDDSTSGGFSSNTKTWLPVASNYKTVNVKAEKDAQKSHLKIFTDLIIIRSSPTLLYGDLVCKALSENVLMIMRVLIKDSTYATFVNIGSQVETIDISGISELAGTVEYYVTSVSSPHSPLEIVDKDKFVLQPKESVVVISEPYQPESVKEYFVYIIYRD